MNEQLIYDKIKVMLDRMEQKKQLQSLAKTNGIELNEMELTDDASDAVVISVIALMLAKMDNDERYRKLCDFGMQKRSLKVEIINDYKQRANMLYNKYKNGDVPTNDETIDDVPYDESFMYDTDDMDEEEIVEEGFGFTTKKNICNRVCEQIDIINPFMEELHKKIDDGEIKDPKTFQKWYRQDVKVSYGISGGSTYGGDSYTGTSVNYEYGEPTLENYILRAKQVIRMSTRDKYVGTVFTREEHDKLERAFMLLYNLNINMSDCCGDYFNSFKEYNPNQYKGLLKKVNDDLTEWIDLSKEIYDFASSKIH